VKFVNNVLSSWRKLKGSDLPSRLEVSCKESHGSICSVRVLSTVCTEYGIDYAIILKYTRQTSSIPLITARYAQYISLKFCFHWYFLTSITHNAHVQESRMMEQAFHDLLEYLVTIYRFYTSEPPNLNDQF